ncbi:uncharacterized protein LOC121873470 isoform X2 [Homarus americanus]|uniref:uncharacterized protein LOC121873470 isoform X2 n=1 Tax=Homarus americanus TaxID=6706 RepID=UPI001C495C0C|nr:uncharacterized protein LOC121873470 isoform X2 [Homarus americanus]
MEVVSGGNITLTCSAQPGHLRAYRWVYIRTGTKRPQVLSSGRRLVVGEPRIALDSKFSRMLHNLHFTSPCYHEIKITSASTVVYICIEIAICILYMVHLIALRTPTTVLVQSCVR